MLRKFIGSIDRLTLALIGLTHAGTQIMSALNNLTAAVQADTTVEASAVTLITGLAAQIKAAAGNNDSAAVQALADQLGASSSALAAAISANTPATAPATAPAAAPAAPAAAAS